VINLKKIILLIICLFPLLLKAEELDIAKNSKSAILIEATTKEVIYEKNSDEKLAPASMTKMMTMLLTMEKLSNKEISLDDDVTISKNAANMGGSQIFIEEGTKIKLEDLLKGIGIASANDAAVAVAEYVGTTYDNFVNMMNEKAKELGLQNTNFKNPHGLDEANHYSTARDLSIIAANLVKYDIILDITSTYEEYIKIKDENRWLVNTNSLIKNYKGIDGLKTGYTEEAKYCLTATMKRNDMRLISVVMGNETKENRSEDTINLMEYGFSIYNMKQILNKNKKLGSIYISKSEKENYDFYLSEDVNLFIKKDRNSEKYTYDIKLNELKAPIIKNTSIGKLILKYDDKTYKYDLVLKEDANKTTYFNLIYKNLKTILSGNIKIMSK
jgi:serine-type D-Ala-D-Ala carboxypeptidase (penicillin-binding protein 5/6)